jgi:integration host factor subunit beta
MVTIKPGRKEMNKSDIAMALSDREGITEKQAAEIVNLIFDGFINTFKNGGRTEIRGFGSFAVKNYGSYTGRDPRTGKSVEVKPKKLPIFKVGRELKKRVDLKK